MTEVESGLARPHPQGTYAAAVKNTLIDAGFKIANIVHRNLFEATKGRLGGTVAGMPALILETTGRKSGQRRSSMLTAPIQEDDDIVLVASKGGDDRHPAWYLNLKADPEVTITMGGRTFAAVAREATGDERATLWPRIVERYKGYAGYEQRTDREIPVVVCTPK